MDYFGILKKAGEVTWRHKVLWVLGFFAVASSSGGSTGNMAQWRDNSTYADLEPFGRWVEQNVVLLVVLAVAFVVFVLVMFVLGIAARGGLAHLVNEAEEGRPVKAGNGWRVGFRYWGRTFMIGLMLGLPMLLIIGVMVILLFGVGFGLAAGFEHESIAAALGFGGMMCGTLVLSVVLILGVGFLVSVIGELAVRYGVLHDVTFGQAIKQGWADLRAKRGAAVMWLVMLLPQFAYGVVILVASFIILIPAILLIVSGAVLAGVGLLFMLVLLLLLPGAIYNTFYSASWTIFFRRMTGAEVATAVSMPGMTQGYAPTSSAPSATEAAPPVVQPVEDVPEV
ncbi:MAG: hypothetical protein Q7J82_03680 [Coriobacteriia bacterium]|nr:hypothetical protein [Coriobacteriia bacterium]